MLSGVGPAEHLRALDIPVVADRPSIGAGLHDHPNVPVFFRADRDIDCYFPQLYSFYRTNPDSALPDGAERHLLRLLAGAVGDEADDAADAAADGGAARLLRAALARLRALAGRRSRSRSPAVQRFTDRLFGIILILGKPKSRGTLRLASADAARQALIDPAYYADAEDLETMVRGVRMARQIGGSAGLKDWGARELAPRQAHASDKAIARYVRKNTITTYHFAGTCAMGASEADAVDTQLRVRGVHGVRVADASAIPVTPVSALNAPSMLIGYRCAQMIARG